MTIQIRLTNGKEIDEFFAIIKEHNINGFFSNQKEGYKTQGTILGALAVLEWEDINFTTDDLSTPILDILREKNFLM